MINFIGNALIALGVIGIGKFFALGDWIFFVGVGVGFGRQWPIGKWTIGGKKRRRR